MTYQSMTIAWCVAILLLAVTGANGLYVLELVQVAHRHGVSPPPVATPNREKMCSPNGASSCTAIAKRGVEQMTAMGAHIRQLYSGDAATFGSATWFQPPYDVSAVSTRSIADPATVQAAAALLGGIYASESATIVPTIISTAPERDALLNVEAFPSSTITRMINAKSVQCGTGGGCGRAVPRRQCRGSHGRGGRPGCCTLFGARHEGVVLSAAAEAGGDVCCGGSHRRRSHCDGEQGQAGCCCRRVLPRLAGLQRQRTPGCGARQPWTAACARAASQHAREDATEGDANRNTKMMMQYATGVPIQTALGHDPSDATPLGETFLVDLLRDDATNAYFVRLRYAAAANDAPGCRLLSVPLSQRGRRADGCHHGGRRHLPLRRLCPVC
ncbi:putative membrane-bound acid phosphatase [Trypanosoma cruzi]|uniref:Putative membrane-bound acid phosphatase n=1 Tax=Trypanosoma cruzi TaxID=5693 RepID=A0A2V2V680_TRYCR|nr:putative membrane-bound acid phosphatase [Trypanosoma cruzi]